MFVKAGSIIPIKLHEGALSLLRAMPKPIKLEIYLSQETYTGTGYLYLDDGHSFSYKTKNQKLKMQYDFNSTTGLLT